MLVIIVLVIFTAFAAACISSMLDSAMEDKMLLHGYYKWLLKAANVHTDALGGIISARWFYFPMGGCVKCMNYWIAFIFYLFLCSKIDISLFDVFFLFWLYEGLSFYFLTKFVTS